MFPYWMVSLSFIDIDAYILPLDGSGQLFIFEVLGIHLTLDQMVLENLRQSCDILVQVFHHWTGKGLKCLVGWCKKCERTYKDRGK